MSEKSWQLTERDREWLTWVGRWVFVTAENIEREWVRRYGKANRRAVLRRVQAAREMGLVETERMVANRPAAIWLTREGMRLVGAGGEATRPRLAEFHHDLYVVDLAQKLLADNPHTQIITERELRREDSPAGQLREAPLFAVQRRDPSGVVMSGNRRVYPDLVTIRTKTGNHLIHEVEHTPKDVRRLVRLMTSYQEANNVDGVRYYVFDAARDRVERAKAIAEKRGQARGNTTPIYVVRWEEFMAEAKEGEA